MLDGLDSLAELVFGRLLRYRSEQECQRVAARVNHTGRLEIGIQLGALLEIPLRGNSYGDGRRRLGSTCTLEDELFSFVV